MKRDKQKVIDESIAYYRRYGEATLRQVFYHLVSLHIIKNDINTYKWLSRLLVDSRKNGDCPEDMLIDRARPRHFHFNYSKWENQPFYIELWVEKDALSSFFLPICKRYNINLVVNKGYPSWTIIKEFIDRMPDSDIKEIKILYFGDFDPSGEDIFRHIGEETGTTVEVIKCALKVGHIETYKLPPMMTKKSDTRTNAFVEKYGDIAVELDALNPEQLTEIVRIEVLKYIDELERARMELEDKKKTKAYWFTEEIFTDVSDALSKAKNVIKLKATKEINYTDEDVEEAKDDILEGNSVDFKYDKSAVKEKLADNFRGQIDSLIEQLQTIRESL